MSGAQPQLRAAEESGSEAALLGALRACATDAEAGLRQLQTAFDARARATVARQIRSSELVDRIVHDALIDLRDRARAGQLPSDPEAALDHAFATLRQHLKRAVATPRPAPSAPCAMARERPVEPPTPPTLPAWLEGPPEPASVEPTSPIPVRSRRPEPPSPRRRVRLRVLIAGLAAIGGLVAGLVWGLPALTGPDGTLAPFLNGPAPALPPALQAREEPISAAPAAPPPAAAEVATRR